MLAGMRPALPFTCPTRGRLANAVWLLLWLLVVLQPLRPMASWAMAPDLNPAQSAAVGESSPCHGHALTTPHADAAGDSVPVTDAAVAAQAAACSACDLCHAAMACPVLAGLGAPVLPGSAPVCSAPTGARTAPADGLFRPPRG